MAHKFLSFLLVTCLTLTFTKVVKSQEIIYECVDNLDEYQRSRWYGAPVSPKWAEKSENLPEQLNGYLHAEGMFYFEGGVQGAQNQSFWKKPADFENITPIYVYLRYYAHVRTPQPKMYIMPVKDLAGGPIKYLESTSDFGWKEMLVEINANLVPWISISIHADMLNVGDYFLLDKVIIVQGAAISGIDDMTEFCTGREPTTSIPVTSEGPEVTTEGPGVTSEEPGVTSEGPGVTSEEPGLTSEGPGVTSEEPGWTSEGPGVTSGEPEVTNGTTSRPPYDCPDAGYFPDKDCTKFHVCQYNQYGEIWDTLMDCPKGFPILNWCQEILKCEYPEICPCDPPQF